LVSRIRHVQVLGPDGDNSDVDVGMPPGDRDKLLHPGPTRGSSHHAQLWKMNHDLVQVFWLAIVHGSGRRKIHTAMDIHGNIQLNTLGIERVHLWVVDSELQLKTLKIQPPQAEILNRVLQFPDCCHALVRIDTSKADVARSMALAERGDILVGKLDPKCRFQVSGLDDNMTRIQPLVGVQVVLYRLFHIWRRSNGLLAFAVHTPVITQMRRLDPQARRGAPKVKKSSDGRVRFAHNHLPSVRSKLPAFRSVTDWTSIFFAIFPDGVLGKLST